MSTSGDEDEVLTCGDQGCDCDCSADTPFADCDCEDLDDEVEYCGGDEEADQLELAAADWEKIAEDLDAAAAEVSQLAGKLSDEEWQDVARVEFNGNAADFATELEEFANQARAVAEFLEGAAEGLREYNSAWRKFGEEMLALGVSIAVTAVVAACIPVVGWLIGAARLAKIGAAIAKVKGAAVTLGSKIKGVKYIIATGATLKKGGLLSKFVYYSVVNTGQSAAIHTGASMVSEQTINPFEVWTWDDVKDTLVSGVSGGAAKSLTKAGPLSSILDRNQFASRAFEGFSSHTFENSLQFVIGDDKGDVAQDWYTGIVAETLKGPGRELIGNELQSVSEGLFLDQIDLGKINDYNFDDLWTPGFADFLYGENPVPDVAKPIDKLVQDSLNDPCGLPENWETTDLDIAAPSNVVSPTAASAIPGGWELSTGGTLVPEHAGELHEPGTPHGFQYYEQTPLLTPNTTDGLWSPSLPDGWTSVEQFGFVHPDHQAAFNGAPGPDYTVSMPPSAGGGGSSMSSDSFGPTGGSVAVSAGLESASTTRPQFALPVG